MRKAEYTKNVNPEFGKAGPAQPQQQQQSTPPPPRPTRDPNAPSQVKWKQNGAQPKQ